MNAPDGNQQASEQPVSLGEAIAEAYDELDTPEELDTQDELETDDETTSEAEAEAEAEEGDDPEEPGDEGSELSETAEEGTEPVEYNVAAPERWPAELKEAYNKLPGEQKQLLLEKVFKPMQAKFTQSTQEVAEMRRELEPMLNTLYQHRDSLQTMGVDAQEAFRRQMAWSAHFAQVGPEQGMKDMAAAYGLNQGQAGNSEAADAYLTPVERSLKERFDRMEQHLSSQQQNQQRWVQQQQQQAAQARAQSIQSDLQAFINEKVDGKLAHPHTEKVGPAMAGLIRGGLVSKTDEYGAARPVRDQIAEAYHLACQMDSSIRSVSPGAARGEQVKRAKRANSSVVGKAPGNAADVPDRPISDEISDLYDKLDRKVG